MDSLTWTNLYNIWIFIALKVSSLKPHFPFTTSVTYFKYINTHQEKDLSFDILYHNVEINNFVKEIIQVAIYMLIPNKTYLLTEIPL